MGFESDRGLMDRPLYAAPLWKPGSAYYSMMSSMFFFVVAEVIFKFPSARIPEWFGWVVLILATISSFHHMRAFDEEYDDWLRMFDLAAAAIFGATSLVLFYNSIVTWIAMALVVVFVRALKASPSPNVKSFWHMWFHLTVCAALISTVIFDL